MEAHGDAAIRHLQANEVLEERQVESDSSHFSSPMTSPALGSTFRSLQEPTLGVYFEPAEGEKNDVLAALRVTRKINRRAFEVVQNVQPQTKQCIDFASSLQAQDKEIRQWILNRCDIDPARTVAIRTLSVFAKLARYARVLRDAEMDLPSPSVSTSRVSVMLRRLSSSASSGSSNFHKENERLDPRMMMAEQRVSASWASLKAGIEDFMKEQAQQTALYATLERIRKDLKITHQLCLPDTRVSVRNSIRTWATSSSEDPLVFVLLGRKGAGKSTMASTACCELTHLDMLRSTHFLDMNGPASGLTTPPARPRSKSLGASFSSLALSPFRSRGQTLQISGKSPVADIIKRIHAPDARGQVIVIDNADSLIHGEGLRLLEVIQSTNSPEGGLRLLLTCTTMPNWLQASNSTTTVKMLTLGESRDADNMTDIATYVSSRMCFSLSAADQQRLVDATDGNFADAVRLCDLVEDGGLPERVLDTVLYQEMVAKHGDDVKIVLV